MPCLKRTPPAAVRWIGETYCCDRGSNEYIVTLYAPFAPIKGIPPHELAPPNLDARFWFWSSLGPLGPKNAPAVRVQPAGARISRRRPSATCITGRTSETCSTSGKPKVRSQRLCWSPSTGAGSARGTRASARLLKDCLDGGISVVAITYRFSQQAIAPAPFDDCARAIQFVRSRAKDWNLDPKRIAATGGSAGPACRCGSDSMTTWPIRKAKTRFGANQRG